MDLIRGLITLGVIIGVVWIANAVFDALGGWPGVIATVAGLAGVIFVVLQYLSREAERSELAAMPERVRAVIEDAQNLFGAAVDTLNEAKTELDEERAPLFWDKFDECIDAIVRCNEKLQTAETLADDYNQRAPRHELTDPEQIGPVPPAAHEDMTALQHEMAAVYYQAMTVPAFGIVYEQRRQGERVRQEQRRMLAEIEALGAETRQAVNAATQAAQAAESARRASKRAAGDWF